MLIAAATGVGIVESLKLSARVRYLEQYIGFISTVETEIRYCAPSLAQILQRHRGDSAFCACFEDCAAEGEETPFPERWEQSVRRIPASSGLTGEDLRLIADFGKGLGASDIEGQLSHCRLGTELAATRLDRAREEKQKKSRLYIMLGLCSGIGAALLLC